MKNAPPAATAAPATRKHLPSPAPAVHGADADAQRMQAAGRDHEAHAVEQCALAWRQLGAMGMTVEDGKAPDHQRRDDQRRAQLEGDGGAQHDGRCGNAVPRRPAAAAPETRACRPAPSPSETPRGRTQIAGSAQLRAPQADGDHREHMVQARRADATSRSASPPACPCSTCANAAWAQNRRQQRQRLRRSKAEPRPHRHAAIKQCDALDRPERAERADHIAGQQSAPSAASDLRACGRRVPARAPARRKPAVRAPRRR